MTEPEPSSVPASFQRPTTEQRKAQRARLRLAQLALCEEPDHAPELRRRREVAAQRGNGRSTFRDAVKERRLDAERAAQQTTDYTSDNEEDHR
jgi:hypothetical protein